MNPPPLPTFPELLVAYRLGRSWSQTMLADLSNLDRSTVTRLEAGDRNPTPDSIASLARALELPDRDRARLLVAAGFVPPEYRRQIAALIDVVASAVLPQQRRVSRKT